MKIRPAEAKFFHADGWSDGRKDRHDEANSRFSRFCSRTFNPLHYVFRVICPRNCQYFSLNLTGLSLWWKPTLCREEETAFFTFYDDSLPAGLSGDQIPVEMRFFTAVLTYPGPTQPRIQELPGLLRR